MSAKDLAFGYRHSAIQESGAVVLSAKFALAPGSHQVIKQEMDRLTHLRELKTTFWNTHLVVRSFKRPVGHFAGQLISEAGLKGYRIGGVEVSEKHAGFMINVADGTAKDYEDLIESVIEKVKEHSGVTLEREVRILGESK